MAKIMYVAGVAESMDDAELLKLVGEVCINDSFGRI